MKLRIAKKILKAVGTEDSRRYSDHQIDKALRRYEKTASAKASNQFWNNMMIFLGPVGRSELVSGLQALRDSGLASFPKEPDREH